jgi:broad specificity phosphatase PhoE
LTILLLIRHASCDPTGRTIVGRTPGIHLNAQGREEARALAAWLTEVRFGAIYSSPLERTRETALAIAGPRGLEVRIAEGLVELDFGRWTGFGLKEVRDDPVWEAFNQRRGSTRIPGGEIMGEVVTRSLAEVRRMVDSHPDQVVAAVSHGDVIRGLLTHFLGMPIDLLPRLEVAPASVHAVRLSPGLEEVRVLLLNGRAGGAGIV